MMSKQFYKEELGKMIAENSELKNKLQELGEDIRNTPNNMQLGKKVRHKYSEYAYNETDDSQLELF